MNSTKHNCWESSLLAAALAVVGTLFLFDKLGSLVQNISFSFDTIVHAAPALIVVLGVSLLLADQGTSTVSRRGKEGDHE
jgi:hypothetical protein